MRFFLGIAALDYSPKKVPHFVTNEAQSELSVALSLSLASCSPAELASVWLNAAIFKIKYYIYNLSKKPATSLSSVIAKRTGAPAGFLFEGVSPIR